MGDTRYIPVAGIGWVLPSGVGAGEAFFDLDPASEPPGPAAGALAGFSPREYLRSVKGYLDPASGYVLAAGALALGAARERVLRGVRDDAGVASATVFGAQLSQYRFLEQLATKGPRLASPLVFPHGYANTAGNLLAIELGFGGPHMVYYGDAGAAKCLLFAALALEDGSANDMLAVVFEATHHAAMPEGIETVNGAVAFFLTAAVSEAPAAWLDMHALCAAAAEPSRTSGKWGVVAEIGELVQGGLVVREPSDRTTKS